MWQVQINEILILIPIRYVVLSVRRNSCSTEQTPITTTNVTFVLHIADYAHIT